MKVLQKGDPENWKVHVQCHNCRAILEVDSGDVKLSKDKHLFYVECPCKAWVSVNHAPNHVKLKFQKKEKETDANTNQG